MMMKTVRNAMLLLWGVLICSPIGMKKQFTTVIHKTAKNFETMIFSGGKIGYQVELSLEDLLKVIPAKLEDVTE